jgi:hypothetical protein
MNAFSLQPMRLVSGVSFGDILNKVRGRAVSMAAVGFKGASCLLSDRSLGIIPHHDGD